MCSVWIISDEWDYWLVSKGDPIWSLIGQLSCSPANVELAASSLSKLWGLCKLIFKPAYSLLPWGSHELSLSLLLSACIRVVVWPCLISHVSTDSISLASYVFADKGQLPWQAFFSSHRNSRQRISDVNTHSRTFLSLTQLLVSLQCGKSTMFKLKVTREGRWGRTNIVRSMGCHCISNFQLLVLWTT